MSHRSVGNEIAINLLIGIGGAKMIQTCNFIPFCSTLANILHAGIVNSVRLFHDTNLLRCITLCVHMCVCDTETNECSSSPCQNNATCYDEINGFTCNCSAGFYGRLCDIGQEEIRLYGCIDFTMQILVALIHNT